MVHFLGVIANMSWHFKGQKGNAFRNHTLVCAIKKKYV